MLVFEERGKPEYPEKNLSEQSREPTGFQQSGFPTDICILLLLKQFIM